MPVHHAPMLLSTTLALLLGLCSLAAHATEKVEPTTVTGWALLGPFESNFIYGAKEDKPSRDGFEKDFLLSLGGEARATFQLGDRIEVGEGRQAIASKPKRVINGVWVDAPKLNGHVG